MKLHTKIMTGLGIGLLAGIITNQIIGPEAANHPDLQWFITNITDPVGQIFLRLLFMVVVPLVFASLALGVANLGNLETLGRIGVRTILYFVLLTAAAAVLGLLLVQIFHPGKSFDPEMQKTLMAQYGSSTSEVIGKSKDITFSVMTFVDMLLPRNMMQAVVTMQMLPIIVLALLFGVMMTRMKNNHMDSVKNILEAVNEFAVGVVDLAMRFAPMAVPCLVFSVSARFGVSVLKPLGFYVILVFAGYILHLFGTYSLVLRLMAGINPLRFFQAVKPVMVTAFSTSSSNATLPTTIRVTEEELKISPNICGFVLPLGATTNMNGTALYEGLTVLFLAEIFGVDLTLGQQAFVVVMTVLTAIGTAGIPGGSLPMIVLVLQSVNVPAEGIGIILGVDRILDMGRTVLNVTGDITAAAYIAKTQGEPAQFNEA